jgi:hypothetical protein
MSLAGGVEPLRNAPGNADLRIGLLPRAAGDSGVSGERRNQESIAVAKTLPAAFSSSLAATMSPEE